MSQSLVKSPILVTEIVFSWKFVHLEPQNPTSVVGKLTWPVREILTTLAVGAGLAKTSRIAAYYLYITEIDFALIPVKRISNLITLHYRIGFGINSVMFPV